MKRRRTLPRRLRVRDAAPALLKALRRALLANDAPGARDNGDCGYCVPADHWMHEARIAIAKATGTARDVERIRETQRGGEACARAMAKVRSEAATW